MKRVDRETLEYTVETTYNFGDLACVQEENYCPWFQALELFTSATADEDVSECSVYYLDSKENKREVLSYIAPCDY